MTFKIGQHVIVLPSWHDEHYRGTKPEHTTIERVGHSYFHVAGTFGQFALRDGLQKVRRGGTPRRVIPAEENH